LRSAEIDKIESALRRSKDGKVKLAPGSIINECCLLTPNFLYLQKYRLKFDTASKPVIAVLSG